MEPVLGVINRANTFITTALSANPPASIAWAGVSLLLPFFQNPSKQGTSLSKDIEHISSLIAQSILWEELYFRCYKSSVSHRESSPPSHIMYKNTLEKLYLQILKFLATSYCYYAENPFSRLGRDIKWNDWDSLLKETKDKEDAFNAIHASWRDKKYDEECEATEVRHQEAIQHWQAIGKDVSGLREAVREAQEEKKRDGLLSWLCEVDPSEIYNTCRDKHQDVTSDWLVRGSKEFINWKESPSSLLWLHGKPGCGKSILSSSVVEHLQEQYASDPASAFASFFFSFSDTEKQKVVVMLASLVKQLYASRPDTPQAIKNLSIYKEKGTRPDTKTLEDVLIAAAIGFSSVSIVIDALDECPTVSNERSNLLGSLSRIITKMPDTFHIFLTSRAESDIVKMMNTLLPWPSRAAIDLTTSQAGINHDIRLYINSTFASPPYKDWDYDVKTKARDLLVQRADGMFQYIICQFDELQKHSSRAAIDEALEKLPNGLYATYDRILQSIDASLQTQVVNLLKWLVASDEPISLKELAEACIIRPERAIPFGKADRLFKSKYCLRHISSLVVKYTASESAASESAAYVRLAHFSVQEYLTRSCIVDSPVAGFLFTEIDAHVHIAYSSLAYHLYRSTLDRKDTYEDYLEYYTTLGWGVQLEMVPHEMWPDNVVRLVVDVLAPYSKSLRMLLARSEDGVDMTFYYMLQRPLCYTARLGFLQLTEMLLQGNPWTLDYLQQRDIDPALCEAAYRGKMAVVELLLSEGAQVNATNSLRGSALLSATSPWSDADIVELLLDNGADINAQSTYFGSALQAAFKEGRFDIVKLLVSRGADVNLCTTTGRGVRPNAGLGTQVY